MEWLGACNRLRLWLHQQKLFHGTSSVRGVAKAMRAVLWMRVVRIALLFVLVKLLFAYPRARPWRKARWYKPAIDLLRFGRLRIELACDVREDVLTRLLEEASAERGEPGDCSAPHKTRPIGWKK